MNGKRLSKERMKSIFVDACVSVLLEKGNARTGLREVATRAGFNQATVYNYFENFDHLKFYAAMRIMRDYTESLAGYVGRAKNSMDRFLLVWKCFALHAFDEPELYQYRFYLYVGKDNDSLVEGYYRDFPQEFSTDLGESITNMLTLTNITDRAMVLVDDLVAEGYILEEDRFAFNELVLVVFEGMFLRVLNARTEKTRALEQTMQFIGDCTRAYLQKPYDFGAFNATFNC